MLRKIFFNTTYKFLSQIIIWIFVLSFSLFCNCKKADEAPAGPTDFEIDLYDAQNINLLTVGGFEYYTGGYNGVVVFNQGGGKFIAFERACPIDHKCKVEVDYSSFSILVCPCCHSKFLNTDGSPFEGEAKSPLRQYVVRYDGERFIYITSF